MGGAFRSITPGQIKKLWVSAKQLGMTDADLHRLVFETTGKESIRLLTSEEAARVIDRLVAAGADRSQSLPPPRGRPQPLPENVIELATEKQIGMISRLLWHLGWQVDDQYFRACVRQAIERENIRTKEEASHVINMLKAKLKELGLEDQMAPSHRSSWGGAPGCGGVQQPA
jgi:hypothetical protein